MGSMHHLSNSAVPIERSQLVQLLESMAAMQNLTAQIAASLLDKLDDIDGDPDVEPNGDEQDGNLGEDDFCIHRPGMWGGGPGCPISDPGGDEHDGREPEDGR